MPTPIPSKRAKKMENYQQKRDLAEHNFNVNPSGNKVLIDDDALEVAKRAAEKYQKKSEESAPAPEPAPEPTLEPAPEPTLEIEKSDPKPTIIESKMCPFLAKTCLLNNCALWVGSPYECCVFIK